MWQQYDDKTRKINNLYREMPAPQLTGEGFYSRDDESYVWS